MTKYTDIGVEKHGHVGLIEIRKPPLNFFDVSLINQIADALEEFDNDIEIRASVLAAQGKAFCAGADFSDPKRQEQEASAQKDPAANLPINHLYVQAVRIFRNKKPVVAAIHGAAIGGGLGLAVSADFRVTCPEARFAANFTKLGFHPGFGLTATLPELVGKNNAELIFYTSRRVTGEEATRMGLANLCVPQDQVRAEAMKLAAEIAECSPLGLISTRATMRAGLRPRPGRHQPRVGRADQTPRDRGFQGRRQSNGRTPRRELQGTLISRSLLLPFSPCGRRCREAPDEGFSPREESAFAERTPHPSQSRFRAIDPPSPTRGEGKCAAWHLPLRHQLERHPAKIKPVARYLAALGLGRVAHLGDIGDPERQPAHQIARALDEAKAGVGQF